MDESEYDNMPDDQKEPELDPAELEEVPEADELPPNDPVPEPE